MRQAQTGFSFGDLGLKLSIEQGLFFLQLFVPMIAVPLVFFLLLGSFGRVNVGQVLIVDLGQQVMQFGLVGYGFPHISLIFGFLLIECGHFYRQIVAGQFGPKHRQAVGRVGGFFLAFGFGFLLQVGQLILVDLLGQLQLLFFQDLAGQRFLNTIHFALVPQILGGFLPGVFIFDSGHPHIINFLGGIFLRFFAGFGLFFGFGFGYAGLLFLGFAKQVKYVLSGRFRGFFPLTLLPRPDIVNGFLIILKVFLEGIKAGFGVYLKVSPEEIGHALTRIPQHIQRVNTQRNERNEPHQHRRGRFKRKIQYINHQSRA